MAGNKKALTARNEALYPNSIGYCIKKYGYTHSEVAQEIGIARKSLYLYCSGRLATPRYTLTKIARTLGCSIEELMTAPTTHSGEATAAALAVQPESPSQSGETFGFRIVLTQEYREILPSLPLPPQRIIDEVQGVSDSDHAALSLDLERDESVKRRDFLRETGHTAVAGTLLLTSRDILGDELLNRFRLALKPPSTLDDKLFHYFERQTEVYWQDRHSATLPSYDLLDYALEHFQKVTRLFEKSLLPTQRLQLCAIASKSALLIGEIYLDMGYYTRAREYDNVAILAAKEANYQLLEAIAWGRISLAWIYSESFQKALYCIQKARSFITKNADRSVSSWLAAIEAEVQAALRDQAACLKALDEAEQVEDEKILQDSYLIRFDRVLLRGYQGASFRRLFDPDDAHSIIYLEKAEKVVQDSITLLDPALKQRLPTFLTDLADIYLKEGKIELACEYATQAAVNAAQIRLQKVVERLHKFRFDLEPWKNTQYVKHFDEQLRPLLT